MKSPFFFQFFSSSGFCAQKKNPPPNFSGDGLMSAGNLKKD